jgi:two-component system nitrate/nitrite response regulator NarL
MPSLVLGNDQLIFMDALSTVLTQHGYEVGAVARCPAEMIAIVGSQRPAACLIDCDPTTAEGLTTIGRIIAASDTTTVVVLSADPDAEAAERALDAGASGYLHQSRGVEALVSALERVLRGELVVELPQAQPGRQPVRLSHVDRLAESLTGRERECLAMLVAGLDTAAMVERMGVSRTTVRTHVQGVFIKLGVHSRLEAASFAVRHRLVDRRAEPGGAAASHERPGLASSAAGPKALPSGPGRTAGWRRPAAQAMSHLSQPVGRVAAASG